MPTYLLHPIPCHPLQLRLHIRFGIGQSPALAVVAAPPPEPEEVQPPWQEPVTMDSLLESYLVETKISGRVPGTTLIICPVKRRNGTTDQISEGQNYKLFIVPRL